MSVTLAEDLAQEFDTEYAIAAPLATRSLLLDAFSIAERTLVVGERGHILVSEDGGKTWAQAKVPTRITLTGIYLLNSRLGWAVGHDAVILKTLDGGWNWERVHNAPADETPLFDVWFKDANRGFAVGAYGYFLVTVDGGQTWSRQEFRVSRDEPSVSIGIAEALPGDDHAPTEDEFSEPFDLHLNRIASADDGRLYIAAEAGRLYRSEDDGDTWSNMASPYHGSFFGVLPLTGDGLLAYGLRGHLFRSEDAGASWQAVETATKEMLTDGLQLQDGRTVIVGLGGTVLISRNNRSFTLRPRPDRTGYSAIVQTEGEAVIVVGEAGVYTLPPSAYAVDTRPQE